MVLLGLARVAEDERRAQGRFGLEGADALDLVEEAGPVSPSAHPAQQRSRCVLQGEVEVGEFGGDDGFDEAVGER